ncbi:MAG TPA: TonB family protein [Acidobacteriaceae bacterium]|nr:TonB family protein [Acidobacteriaceae bacterium]
MAAPPQSRRSTLLSALLHAAVLAAVVLLPRLHSPEIAPRRLPGTAHGTLPLQAFQLQGSPPGASAPTPATPEHPRGPALPRPHKGVQHKAPQLSTPATPSTAGNAAEGALGDGDIRIALPQSHPRPEPDLSALPPGTGGDVVLDALIDAQGRIAHLSVTRSLGAAVDQQVIATVQQWTFTPAMRNGTPIASEQEILFHYDRS